MEISSQESWAAEMWKELQAAVDELSPAGNQAGHITEDEEDLIVRLHRLLGNRWTLIAGRLPGRTDNEIKNHWNTHVVKKLKKAGMLSHHKPHKDLPKPPRVKKTYAGAARSKKKKGVKRAGNSAANDDRGSRTEEAANSKDVPTKIKVYMPRAVRVTSSFSMTDSFNNLPIAFSSSGEDAASRQMEVSYTPMDWPICGMEYRVDDVFGDGDDLLAGYCALPTPNSDYYHDFTMADHVYNEYLNLI